MFIIDSAATPSRVPTRTGKFSVAALQERYAKSKQEISESVGKDKIGSSSTAMLNIILDNDAAKSSASKAILSESKKRILEFPESSYSKYTLDQLQSFIEKRGVDLVSTLALLFLKITPLGIYSPRGICLLDFCSVTT